MKIKNIQYLFFLLPIYIYSCKEVVKDFRDNKKNTNSDTIIISTENKTDEIFVGKFFYSGDELNNYSFIKSDSLIEEDCLSYSIYKQNNQEEYVLSIEKLISNNDQEKYKIIDIFRFSDYSQNTKIQLNQEENSHTILLINNGNVLKKWTFNRKKKQQVSVSWDGKYQGSFLRMKEESADPRAYATVELQIFKDKIIFNYYSYSEEKNYALEIIEQKEDTVVFKPKNNNNICLIKKGTKYYLESSYIDNLMNEKQKIEMKKIE